MDKRKQGAKKRLDKLLFIVFIRKFMADTPNPLGTAKARRVKTAGNSRNKPIFEN